jgi:hypothetical protein
MSLLIGILLALSAAAFGALARINRERGFYPVVTVIVGSYYVLFAAMGATPRVLIIESLTGVLFIVAAITGARRSLWIVVVALAAHGLFDLTHDHFIVNAGVPRWWPEFCMAYDVTAAALLAFLLLTRRLAAQPTPEPTALSH